MPRIQYKEKHRELPPEVSPEQEQEVVNALRQFPKGVGFDALFSMATTFVERAELSRVVHALSQRLVVFKHGGLYFLTEVTTPEQVEAEASEKAASEKSMHFRVLSTKIKESATKTPETVKPQGAPKLPVPHIPTQAHRAEKPKTNVETPVQHATLPDGDGRSTIRPDTIVGKVAYVLWRYRNEQYYLRIERIREAAGLSKLANSASLYQALSTLYSRNFINKAGHGHGVGYKWSGNYTYPFAYASSNDANMIHILPASERPAGTVLGLVNVGHKEVEMVSKAQPAPAPQKKPSTTSPVPDLAAAKQAIEKITDPASKESALAILEAAIATHETTLSLLRALQTVLKL